MAREESLIRILAANAKLQLHMAVILEAKGTELAKSRNWLCAHIRPDGYPDHDQQLKEPLKIHEQIVEVLDGIVKVENGLAKNLEILIGPEEEQESFGSGGLLFNNIFGSDGDIR